jgi:hypothetical protein
MNAEAFVSSVRDPTTQSPAGESTGSTIIRVTQDCDRSFGDHSQRLHARGKTVDLSAINLVASEGARQCIDADILRLNVAGGFVDLLIKRSSFREGADRPSCPTT